MGDGDRFDASEVLDHLMEGCQLIDRDYRYVYLNRAAAEHGRHDPLDLVGRKMTECFPGIDETEMFMLLRQCMEDRTPRTMVNEFLHADGAREWYELRFHPVPQGVFVLSLNVTERRRIEESARASQRLEAVGRLAAGIAHDFNNLLTVINAYAAMSLEELDDEEFVRSSLSEIQLAGERAASLTSQLLAFSRRQVLEPQVVSVNDIVDSLRSMLGRLLTEDIELRFVLAADAGKTLVDPGQLEQVIMNLAINSRDAMPRGGRLTIESFSIRLDEAYAELHPGVEPGDYVGLTVSDTGEGMTPEVRERVFEPFFTTKVQGKGTGLGLATVHGIVRQSGGHVWVYSEPGAGTSFKIYLPSATGQLTERSVANVDTEARPGERVLVAEDQDGVRRVVQKVLEQAGYEVLLAANGVEALEVAENDSGEIMLLLTDVVMPRMSGRELADRLRERRPEVRVLYTSGYTDSAIVDQGVLEPNTHFVSKPFTVGDLLSAVRIAIDSEDA